MDFYRDRICIVLETMHGFSLGAAPSESHEIGRPLHVDECTLILHKMYSEAGRVFLENVMMNDLGIITALGR